MRRKAQTGGSIEAIEGPVEAVVGPSDPVGGEHGLSLRAEGRLQRNDAVEQVSHEDAVVFDKVHAKEREAARTVLEAPEGETVRSAPRVRSAWENGVGWRTSLLALLAAAPWPS